MSPFLLFISREMTAAIFYQHNQYFVFDSHARDLNGLPDEYGSAVILSFDTSTTLIQYLESMYRGQEFNISPVELIVTAECIVNELNNANNQPQQLNGRNLHLDSEPHTSNHNSCVDDEPRVENNDSSENENLYSIPDSAFETFLRHYNDIYAPPASENQKGSVFENDRCMESKGKEKMLPILNLTMKVLLVL